MNSLCRLSVTVFTVLVISGCALKFPYRSQAFEPLPNADCKRLYDKYAEGQDLKKGDPFDAASPCWLRSIEERKAYDLMTVEFDDQGWVQNSSDLKRPDEDYLDKFFSQLEQLKENYKSRGLLLVVFVHGWQHNAEANDNNVRNFRKFLNHFTKIESGEDKGKAGQRVIGIYVGWRGKSIDIPFVELASFWDRKNTAEHVSQGSTREFFARLNAFRARADKEQPVHMLAIGHSFGGLILYKALSSEFLQAAVSHKEGDFSRQGDLVVIANPAFEGSRYEPLKIAGQRLKNIDAKKQLPVVIIATSEADRATGVAFPLARTVNALFESTPGYEGKANTRTVGHNDRYTTHKLSTCNTKSDSNCRDSCSVLPNPVATGSEDNHATIDYANEGFKTSTEYLCNGLKLVGTDQWTPIGNPFWVVETTGEIMKNHDDIFNSNMQAFILQMYEAIIRRTDRPK